MFLFKLYVYSLALSIVANHTHSIWTCECNGQSEMFIIPAHKQHTSTLSVKPGEWHPKLVLTADLIILEIYLKKNPIDFGTMEHFLVLWLYMALNLTLLVENAVITVNKVYNVNTCAEISVELRWLTASVIINNSFFVRFLYINYWHIVLVHHHHHAALLFSTIQIEYINTHSHWHTLIISCQNEVEEMMQPFQLGFLWLSKM